MEVSKEKESLISAKSLEEARYKQKVISNYLKFSEKKIKSLKEIKYVAGVDVGYKNNIAKVAVVVYDYRKRIREKVFLFREKVDFPYRAGFFAFREGRVIVEAFKKINFIPDILVFDGHGRLHPLGLGLAAHTGFVLDIASIGCAKNLFYGYYKSLKREKFSQSFVRGETGDIIGIALRSKKNCKTIFISSGYGINLDICVKLIKGFITDYRMPDIMRESHILSRI